MQITPKFHIYRLLVKIILQTGHETSLQKSGQSLQKFFVNFILKILLKAKKKIPFLLYYFLSFNYKLKISHKSMQKIKYMLLYAIFLFQNRYNTNSVRYAITDNAEAMAFFQINSFSGQITTRTSLAASKLEEFKVCNYY